MTKIYLTNLVIFKYFVRMAVRDNLTIAQYISTVAYSQGLSHIMVSDQNTDIETDQVFDTFLDINHRDRIDAGKWLIQQDKSGF